MALRELLKKLVAPVPCKVVLTVKVSMTEEVALREDTRRLAMVDDAAET